MAGLPETIPVGRPLAESLGEMIPFAERSPTMMVFEVPSVMPLDLERSTPLLADDRRPLIVDRTPRCFFSFASARSGPITATDNANATILIAVEILFFIVFMTSSFV